jgi:hypothetical protein
MFYFAIFIELSNHCNDYIINYINEILHHKNTLVFNNAYKYDLYIKSKENYDIKKDEISFHFENIYIINYNSDWLHHAYGYNIYDFYYNATCSIQLNIMEFIKRSIVGNEHALLFKHNNVDDIVFITHSNLKEYYKTLNENYLINIKLQNNPLLVICNGKSAADIDFELLKKSNIDTFAMNSAYKKFDELNFYPDYYSNLDSVVIRSHQNNLQTVMDKCNIRKCFYLSTVDFNCKHNYFKVIKTTSPWKGLSASNSNFSSWANTGSDCVQLGLMMGYKKIYIIGVDGYTEMIDQSKITNKHTLVITETPKDNPNYWFNTYQEKNDEYNIPNAERWHIPGWNYTKRICDLLNVPIINLSHNKNYVKCIEFSTFHTIIKYYQ